MSLANYTAGHTEARPIPLEPPAIGRLTEVLVPTLILHGDLDVSGVTAGAEALELGIAVLDEQGLPATSHAVERGNRRHRKRQKGVDRVRSKAC